ncbi:alkenal/one oxidoreductase, chloroplastic [Seminavis robusta]|uniref:Alkenal/one oxidoreductase, chloroplastic n=1 Tax=Seminavis robusta TaxID=568900 RepID=A0A9N8F1X5_9STRA|nr:alkenal/one oxidoreductase, chloroplastic [Seminavis robusta]|eukprot:Sro2718_g335430.1 alkenal/one oxidoreductase, chloroplastic (352) ;mRNA; r:6538-7593
MKAIQVHEFVEDFEILQGNDSLMSMNNNVDKPVPKKGEILVQVQACSLSPGDIIMVHGNLIFLHEARPFVPGMDISGVVVDNNGSKLFQEGDGVVASNGVSPVGGMAEYMVVNENEVVLKPSKVSVQEGAASSSAITARNAVMDNVKEGDRVLILGGSGGVGSAAIQIAKTHAKASFVATTSTQTNLCKTLGADQVVNYREENWWEMDWQGGQKFDVIIDTVGGGNFYGRAPFVLKTGKQGGKFVAVTGDDTRPDCRTVWKGIKFIASMPWRPLYTSLRARTYPKYILIMPYDILQGRKQVLEWMQEGSLKVPIDEESPLPFTADGVRAAFTKVASGHAHGKVVVTMSTSN